MKATTCLRWAIVLLLLGLITRNLLAQPVPPRPEGWSDAYPAPAPVEPYPEPYPWPSVAPVGPYPVPPPLDPYPWPTSLIIPTRTPAIPIVSEDEGPRLLVAEKAKRKPSGRATPVESIVQPTVVFVPSPEDIATARRYGDYVEERLLSDEGWWK